MAKKYYEVTTVNTAYLPQISGQVSSFSVPLPEEFETRENAEEYMRTIEKQASNVLCSIREVER